MKLRPLFIGLVTGLVAVALLLIYLRRVEQEASGGRKVQILVARETIARGKPITESMIGTREIPIAYLDNRVVRAADKEKVLGLVATNMVPVQEMVAWSDVTSAKDDQRALSALVQPGNRAMPVKVQITDVLALVHPGDFVDVVCVCGEAKEATVLLQRVLVLATGTDLSVSDKKDASPRRATILTLSVSLQESQLLAIAMEKGKLNAAVRSPNDQRIAEAPADVGASALTDSSRRQPVQGPHRRTPSGPTELKEAR